MEKLFQLTSEATLAQQCYDLLKDEIIQGILKPGQKLKVIPIKERLQVGQSPVREALSRLAASGLVEVEDNKGFRVATVSEEDIRDTYQTFTAIENMALELSINRGDASWEASIVAELYKLGLIENNNCCSNSEWAEQNYNFHVALIAGCNSPTLLDIRRNLYMKFDRYCRLGYQISKDYSLANHEEHKKLAHAILQKDITKAQELMSYHINGALEDVIKKLQVKKLL